MSDWGAIRLVYHDHYVVDGGKRRIIVAALVTPADVMESQAMRDLLWRVYFRRKNWPCHVTGDAKYGTTENVVTIEDAGIRAYVPLTNFEHRSDFYGRDKVTYDAKRDQYCCPQGHPLPLARRKWTEGVVVYRGDPAICNACPVKEHCTSSDRGRTIQRSIYEAYLERVRGYHATESYNKAIRKRQVWVEPLSDEPKEWHGLRRLRLRGLFNANIQGLLIAAGQNLKRFLAARGWGPRHAPCGSLLALRVDPGPLRVMTHPTVTGAPVSWIVTATPASGDFFQRPEPLCDPRLAQSPTLSTAAGIDPLGGTGGEWSHPRCLDRGKGDRVRRRPRTWGRWFPHHDVIGAIACCHQEQLLLGQLRERPGLRHEGDPQACRRGTGEQVDGRQLGHDPSGHERIQEVGSEDEGNGNNLARLDFGQQEAALIPTKPEQVDEECQADVAEHAIDLGQDRAMRQLPLPQAGGGMQEQWSHDDEVDQNGQQPREALSGADNPLPESARWRGEDPIQDRDEQQQQRVVKQPPQGVDGLQGDVRRWEVERCDLDRQLPVIGVDID